jgi:hypothetical protein
MPTHSKINLMHGTKVSSTITTKLLRKLMRCMLFQSAELVKNKYLTKKITRISVSRYEPYHQNCWKAQEKNLLPRKITSNQFWLYFLCNNYPKLKKCTA